MINIKKGDIFEGNLALNFRGDAFLKTDELFGRD